MSPTHYSSGMYTPGEMSREGSDGEDSTTGAQVSISSASQSIAQHPVGATIISPAHSRLLQLHGTAVRTIQSAPGSPQGMK